MSSIACIYHSNDDELHGRSPLCGSYNDPRIISKSKPISKIRRTNTRWDLIEQQRQRRFESSNRCIKLTPIRRDGISRIRVIPLYMNCFDWISFMPSHNHCNLVAGALNNVIQAGIHDMIRRIELFQTAMARSTLAMHGSSSLFTSAPLVASHAMSSSPFTTRIRCREL